MENVTLKIEELFQNLTLYLHNETIAVNTEIVVEPTSVRCTDGNYRMGEVCGMHYTCVYILSPRPHIHVICTTSPVLK